MNIHIEALKEHLPTYLERRLPDRIKNRHSRGIQFQCPFHGEDKHPSCCANNAKGTWLWHCFTCHKNGSIFDLHGHLEGIAPMSQKSIQGVANQVGYDLPDLAPLTTPEKLEVIAQKRKSEVIFRRRNLATQKQTSINAALRSCRDSLFARYLSPQWRYNLWDNSPITLHDPLVSPFEFVRNLFEPDDIIWMGAPFDSGRSKHKSHFKPSSEWLKLEILPPRIAAGVFSPNCISRSLENVAKQKFIVIESDELIGHKPTTELERLKNKEMSCALIIYMRDILGFNLRAVIDTSHRSLHGWFDRPGAGEMEALTQLAQGLGIDTSVLTKADSLPLRLPGAIHEKTNQRATLLWLNLKK
ncbi:hypothetical protein HW115_08520 [Verrucomicrobiaceae bacterium N1E253]|uniref:Zinc finger CHC2-type domain-containing protein n=1 Tax=Oceaniferula marina TaxID=2748318 RepID=A0A851GDM5_9BACT|nr:CHC2 zinc finger domain-containing protein [Oceaniferula marina]NWK55653.1 hypothetical protein [Oceaniferula marina]